jgi:predicted nucleic acid-binding protein
MIAATAHANGLALYTRHAADFVGLEGLMTVVAI